MTVTPNVPNITGQVEEHTLTFNEDDITEIIFILDRSGSMHSMAEEARGGFNGFIERQRGIPGRARVTLVIFDTNNNGAAIETVHDGVDIDDVPELTPDIYYARGGTPLNQAIGETVTRCLSRITSLPPEEQPSNVILGIVTDGHENSSNDEWRGRERIQQLLTGLQENSNWIINYLGANVDAFDEGHTLGVMDQGNMYNFAPTASGMACAFAATTANTISYRQAGGGGTVTSNRGTLGTNTHTLEMPEYEDNGDGTWTIRVRGTAVSTDEETA